MLLVGNSNLSISQRQSSLFDCRTSAHNVALESLQSDTQV